MATNPPTRPDYHPIQVAARRSGLSADVIRVWERRYAAVCPVREGSRRLYSDADVARLILLRKVTAGGRRIGDVATLDDAALQRLAQDDESLSATGARAGSAIDYLDAALQAAERLDPGALQQVLASAVVNLSRPILFSDVVAPLMRELGRRWRAGEMRICHEHLATAQVVPFLGAMLAGTDMSQGGPSLVVTTPAGQRHEVGALLAALTAASEGWRVVYLGPNTPASEIAATVLQRRARAVALSIVYPPDDPALHDELRQLRALLPAGVPLLLGGAAASPYAGNLGEADITELDDLDALRQALAQLRVQR